MAECVPGWGAAGLIAAGSLEALAVSNPIAAVLDADDEELGPVFVRDRASVIVTTDGTATVTPHVSHVAGSGYLAITGSALTESGAFEVQGPVHLKLVASAVSGGGSAACSVLVRQAGL